MRVDDQHNALIRLAEERFGINLKPLPLDHPPLALRRHADRCFHAIEEITPEGFILHDFLVRIDEVADLIDTRRHSTDTPLSCNEH